MTPAGLSEQSVARALRPSRRTHLVFTMLRWALIFFIIAIVAALLGFTGIAGAAASIAKIIFMVFIALLLVALLILALGGPRSPKA